jgi:hypothetical protein
MPVMFSPIEEMKSASMTATGGKLCYAEPLS